MASASERRARVLLVSSSRPVHAQVRAALSCGDHGAGNLRDTPTSPALRSCRTSLRGFEVDSAFHPEEAIWLMLESQRQGRPYAVAVVDHSTRCGWSGLITLRRLWTEDSELEGLILADDQIPSVEDLESQLGSTDQAVVLARPVAPATLLPAMRCLAGKWRMQRQARLELAALGRLSTADMPGRVRRSEPEPHSLAAAAVAQVVVHVGDTLGEPLEVVGDSVHLIADALETFGALTRTCRERARRGADLDPEILACLRQLERTADLEWLTSATQGWSTQMFGALERMRATVRAMQHLSDADSAPRVDVNRVVTDAVARARVQLGRLGEVSIELGEVPAVSVSAGALTDTLMGLIVDAGRGLRPDRAEGAGRIRVSTARHQDTVVVKIESPEGAESAIPDAHAADASPRLTLLPSGIHVDRHEPTTQGGTPTGGATRFTVRLPLQAQTPWLAAAPGGR